MRNYNKQISSRSKKSIESSGVLYNKNPDYNAFDNNLGIDNMSRSREKIDVSNLYDYCSISHYGGNTVFENHIVKVPHMRGIGCTLGQDWLENAKPSVLDIQKVNSKYQCGNPYDNLENKCADYFM